MKSSLHILGLGLFIMTLSSCTTYVDGGGQVGARPGYAYRTPPPPAYYRSGYGYAHDRYHPTYYARPAPRPAGVDARVNARVGLPVNASTSTRLSLF